MKQLKVFFSTLGIVDCMTILVPLTISSLTFTPILNAGTGQRLVPKDANLAIQQEVLATSLGATAQLIGPDPNNKLSWSGSVTDTGWTLTITAGTCNTLGCPNNYRDGRLELNYSGFYDKTTDVITWTGGGSFTNSIGSVTWDTPGSYTDATVDGLFSWAKDATKWVDHHAAAIWGAFLGGSQIAGTVACAVATAGACGATATEVGVALAWSSGLLFLETTNKNQSATVTVEKAISDERCRQKAESRWCSV